MRITSPRRPTRPGTVLPMLALCLVALFGFVALAVDLGLLAVSRTECQNAADIAALMGCRTLNNKVGSVNSNLENALTTARDAVTTNNHLNANFTSGQIAKIQAGQYLYDSSTQLFQVSSWTDVTNDSSASPTSGSWTAIRITLEVSQPTYFMRVFGVNAMPSGAVATAVYRPRDIAFALDMTSSMAYASLFNRNGTSNNPDTLAPSFGHYVSVQSALIASADTTDPTTGEVYSRNNYTITTRAGPPIVRNFYYDTSNVSTPATAAYPVVVANLANAFHCIPSSAETPGDAASYASPTYDFGSYNAFDTSRTNGPTPAPETFKTMTGDSYVGDRWRRSDGSINKTDTTWSTATVTTKGATTALELLGYRMGTGANATTVCGGTVGGPPIIGEDQFRDGVWEKYGYDLDIVAYRAFKGNGNPANPDTYSATLVPSAERFKGYSMGPGYWGKSFFIWPPDGRTPVGNPGDNNYVAGDWRQRYFTQSNGTTALDPQVDNLTGTTGTNGVSQALLNSSSGLTLSTFTGNWGVNYPAVLKWIKSGPQTLPPNLRAGRVLYYSSIPDDVDTSTGGTQERLDKIFWKKYIDYVFARGYPGLGFGYGRGDSWTASPRTVYTSDLNTWTGPDGTWPAKRPYLRYGDSPNRPRLQFWFGPLTMMDFLKSQTGNNWLPGTCYEAQNWQLKAGMNSVIDDVRNNHPNDYMGMVMFSTPHNGARVAMCQDYTALKNALFYPKSLLSAINGGDTTTEVRPYTDVNFTPVAMTEIPNAVGITDMNSGLAYSFNLLAPSSLLPSEYIAYTTGTPPQPIQGRRGAAKTIIFETDGVPDSYRGSAAGSPLAPTLRGYETYYPAGAYASGYVGNGDTNSMQYAYDVAQQFTKQMVTTTSGDSGLSLPNAPARIYPVAFGDLFDETLAPGATFRPTARQFLANIAYYGGTGESGASTIPDYQIITGTYDQRITRIKDCMQRIFQSGVAVTLVE